MSSKRALPPEVELEIAAALRQRRDLSDKSLTARFGVSVTTLYRTAQRVWHGLDRRQAKRKVGR